MGITWTEAAERVERALGVGHGWEVAVEADRAGECVRLTRDSQSIEASELLAIRRAFPGARISVAAWEHAERLRARARTRFCVTMRGVGIRAA